MDQPGKVANPARGQLNRKNNIPLSPCVPENLVSRDGFSRPVPRQSAHLHTQAESGAYLRDSSRVPRRRPFMKPPYAIGSVSSLSGHAIFWVVVVTMYVVTDREFVDTGSIPTILVYFFFICDTFFCPQRATSRKYNSGSDLK